MTRIQTRLYWAPATAFLKLSMPAKLGRHLLTGMVVADIATDPGIAISCTRLV